MKVYVGTYHKYNCDSLDCKWFDLDDYVSYEDFIDDCLEFHKDEDDPELMFQDYEIYDDFDKFFASSHDIRNYFEACEELDRCGENRQFVVTVANHLSWSTEELARNIRDISDYAFYESSLEDYFIYVLGEECSESLRKYIDWEDYAESRDEDFEPYNDGYIIFTNN